MKNIDVMDIIAKLLGSLFLLSSLMYWLLFGNMYEIIFISALYLIVAFIFLYAAIEG